MTISHIDFAEGGSVGATSVTVGNGNAQVGDLCVFEVMNTNTPGTATIGATSGITPDVTADNGSGRANIFHKILEAGDISGGNVVCTPSSHSTGGSRRLAAYVKRSSVGFDSPTVLVGTESTTTTGATSNTLTEVNETKRPAFGVVCLYLGTSLTPTASWDGGTARAPDFPNPQISGGSAVFGKGNDLGTEVEYPADPSRTQHSVVIASLTTGVTRAIAFAIYQELELLYVTTSARISVARSLNNFTPYTAFSQYLKTRGVARISGRFSPITNSVSINYVDVTVKSTPVVTNNFVFIKTSFDTFTARSSPVLSNVAMTPTTRSMLNFKSKSVTNARASFLQTGDAPPESNGGFFMLMGGGL